MSCDIIVIGGGIAGLSAAAALANHARVTVLEAEDQAGFHATGRSATMLHYALGDPHVRALTLESRGFFEHPPEGFSDAPIGQRTPVLIHAREEETETLEALEESIAPFASLQRVGERELLQLCPVLRVGDGGAVTGIVDANGIRLDPHALLQGHLRQLRRRGGEMVTGARVSKLTRVGREWRVETDQGQLFSSPLIVNAAGAWADAIALLAGVRPLGLQPLRRTVITFDPPPQFDVRDWPFAKTVGDELYFAPESGRLLASPMDEEPSDPCDARPEDYDVALAAHRVEQRTTMPVERIHSRWAGLRTFAPDRHLVAGFADDSEGFFWLAGQGGFGLQTSPAMAAAVTSLIAGSDWPSQRVAAAELSPARFATG